MDFSHFQQQERNGDNGPEIRTVADFHIPNREDTGGPTLGDLWHFVNRTAWALGGNATIAVVGEGSPPAVVIRAAGEWYPIPF